MTAETDLMTAETTYTTVLGQSTDNDGEITTLQSDYADLMS